jgi:hypothetical protein
MHLLSKLIAYGIKEFRVVARDPASLAILFVMPIGFVIIMSLALQDFFDRPSDNTTGQRAAGHFSLVLLDGDRGDIADAIYLQLSRLGIAQVRRVPTADFARVAAQLRERVRTGQGALRTAHSARPVSERVRHRTGRHRTQHNCSMSRPTARSCSGPAHRPGGTQLTSACWSAIAIEQVLLGRRDPSAAIARALGGSSAAHGPRTITPTRQNPSSDGLLGVNEPVTRAALPQILAPHPPRQLPTSTQQNVSAYSLLAIFMLIVPLSQTFIKERVPREPLGRLRSMGVPGLVIVGGKVPPYSSDQPSCRWRCACAWGAFVSAAGWAVRRLQIGRLAGWHHHPLSVEQPRRDRLCTGGVDVCTYRRTGHRFRRGGNSAAGRPRWYHGSEDGYASVAARLRSVVSARMGAGWVP